MDGCVGEWVCFSDIVSAYQFHICLCVYACMLVRFPACLQVRVFKLITLLATAADLSGMT